MALGLLSAGGGLPTVEAGAAAKARPGEQEREGQQEQRQKSELPGEQEGDAQK